MSDDLDQIQSVPFSCDIRGSVLPFSEYAGKVKVCKVNVDDEGAIAAQNAIETIPTVILFVDGKPVKKLIGAHAIDDYEDAIDELL